MKSADHGAGINLPRLLEKALPQLTILSYNELMPRVEVQSVGVVSVADAN